MHRAAVLPSLRAKPLVLITTLLTTLTLPLISFPDIAHATTCGITCTYSDPWGTQEVSASGWIGGSGVPIYSNGPLAPDGPSPDTYNYINNINGDSTQTGIEWQCVELVNRLYITKGWTTSTWSGNGGQLYDNAPGNLTKELNGSITSLSPGDALVLQNSSFGHAAVINTYNSSTGAIQIASQNTNQVYDGSSFTLSGSTISKASGSWAGYTIKGVVHHPTATPTHLYQFYVSGGAWNAYDVSADTGITITGNPASAGLGAEWARGSNNHLYQFWLSGTTWNYADLTGATNVGISGDPVPDSSGQVWARDTNNHFRQFYISGGSWHAADITGATSIAISGNPAIGNGAEWARGTNNHLYQFYVSGSSWVSADITTQVNVGLAGDPYVGNGAEWARDSNSHLRQFYVSGGTWHAADLTAAVNVGIAGDPIPDSSGQAWVRDSNNHFRQFYVSGGAWHAADITGATGVGIKGNPTLGNGAEWARGSNDHLYQFYVSGSWQAADVTSGGAGVGITTNPAVDTIGEFGAS